MPDQPSGTALSSHVTLWLIGTGMMILVTAALIVMGPGDATVCLIRQATGVSCPGCGLTRAAAAMWRGEWLAMWRLHPLAPFITVQVFVVWALWGWTVFVRRQRFDEPVLLWLLIGNFALLAAVWVVRLFGGTLPV